MNMDCTRFQTDGMRLLDGELDEAEKAQYEEHVRGCEICRKELTELGRVVNLTDELRLRTPDDEFWDGYWDSVYRRSERRFGFLFVVIGIVTLLWLSSILYSSLRTGLNTIFNIKTPNRLS